MKFFVALLLSLFSTASSARPSHFTSSYRYSKSNSSSPHWITAGATWYGAPNGFGSDGGSCGYGTAVYHSPFLSMVSSVSPNLYFSGDGCGACYKIKCTSHKSCSGKEVVVVLTDSCPGCYSQKSQFDMSGTSFGAMAINGQETTLRNAGSVQIQYMRTKCLYGQTKLTFRVDGGSNGYYFAMVVEYQDGDGDLSSVEIKQARGERWEKMDHSWGAVWEFQSHTGLPLEAPFSFRLTPMGSDEKPLVVRRAIPKKWEPGLTYRSLSNFKV